MIVPIIYVSSFGGTMNMYKRYLNVYLEDFFFGKCRKGRMRIMWSMYCIEPLGRIYRSTWLGGQVVSPRDKEGYPGITINPKLTISGVA